MRLTNHQYKNKGIERRPYSCPDAVQVQKLSKPGYCSSLEAWKTAIAVQRQSNC